MSKKDSRTFWEIMNQYQIIIPTIQRDYVQGRPTKEVEEARESLLNDMKEAVNTLEALNLNFVYGKVADAQFLPLDGQQRLTTLFLLHWFALLCKQDIPRNQLEDGVKVLSGFSYQARSSSRDFFERITAFKLFSDIHTIWKASSERLSACIVDASWFHPNWRYDPTIDSTLTVLDRMEILFSDCDDLWIKLTDSDKCPIRFEWLDVEHIGNEDDLYIKMNARGKILTPYENLKAELEKATQNILDPSEHAEFFSNLDQKWSDFFWQTGAPENYDNKMYSFLIWTLWNQWSILNSGESKGTGGVSKVRNLQAGKSNLTMGDFDTGLVAASVLSKRTLDYIRYTLDYVSSDNANQMIVSIVDQASPAARNPEYPERIMLQVVQSYLYQVKGVFDEKSWSEWYRVASNLIHFAKRYQGFNTLDRYSGAVKCIVSMERFVGNLLAQLADENNTVTGFVPNEQILEERIKAVLMQKEMKWREAIISGEGIRYFEGKIGFLLSYCGIDTMEKAKNATAANLELFNSYLNLITNIFDSSDLLINGNLLRRSLLTKGDYSMRSKKLKYYIVQNDRDVDWRAYFRMHDKDHRKANSYFKLLLDDIANRNTDVESAMSGIISDYVWDDSREDTWAKHFIEEPLLFSEIGTNFQFRISSFHSGNPVCWMPYGANTVASGLNKELLTTLTAIRLRSLGWSAEWRQETKGMQPGIQYDVSCDGKIYHIGLSDDCSSGLICVLKRNREGNYVQIFNSNDYSQIIQFLSEQLDSN